MLSVCRWGYSQVSREREPFFTWRRVQSTVSRVLYLIKSELEIQMTLESSAGRRDCVQPKIWRTMYSLHSMSYRLAPTNQFSFFVLVSKQTESMSVRSLSSHIISNELYQAGCNPMPCAQNQMRRWILTIKGWRGLKASRVYVPKYQRQNCWVRRLPASPLLPIFLGKNLIEIHKLRQRVFWYDTPVMPRKHSWNIVCDIEFSGRQISNMSIVRVNPVLGLSSWLYKCFF